MPINYKLHKKLGLCVRCTATKTHGSYCEKHYLDYKQKKKIFRLKKIASGICVDCQEPASSENEYCEKHSYKRNLRKLNRAEKRRVEKLCIQCGKPVLDPFLLCAEHHFIDYDRGVKKCHKKKMQGICYNCDLPAINNTCFCADHLESFRRYTQSRRDKFTEQDKCNCGRELDNDSNTCMVCAERKYRYKKRGK